MVEPRANRPAFDRKAASYDTHAHVQRDTAAWVAEWLPSAPAPTDRCLELGAGTGNFTRHLATRFARLCATDLAPGMVAQGRLAFPAVDWREHDAWQPDNTPSGQPAHWDFLASCSLLQWAPDPAGVLTRWRRLLRPGGQHLSGIYIAPSLPQFAALQPGRQPFPWQTADQWRDHFAAAGFTDIRMETRTRDYVYPSARALLRQLHGTGATVTDNPMPPGEVRAFLRHYEATYRRPGGVPATWTFCRLACTA